MSHVSQAIEQAARELVSHYPGGADALGAMLGKRKGVLSNEINARCPHAKLGFEDAVRGELEAENPALLYAHAHLLGHVCHRLPGADWFGGDASLLEAFAKWQGANGATCDAIRASVDPDSPGGTGITLDEVDAIASAGERQVAEFLELLARFRATAQPAKTAQPDHQVA